MKTVVFTSAAVNYLPKVRKLCASIKKFHPEFEVVFALSDKVWDGIDMENEPIDRIVSLDQLDIEDRVRWAFFHDIVELSTAIKPFVLKQLLAEEGVERVLYFDPDMVLFSRLDDLLERLDASSIVLTPHQTSPETTLDAIMDNEISSLKHGVYNLGFLGVRPTNEGKRFAQWWADRIYHFCVADIPRGLFTDQRWIDLVPAFFDEVGILKSPRFNVATWNLTTREMTGNDEDGFRIDGEPLGFYHFTGFDSGAHKVMADKNAAGNRSVSDIVGWYAKETRFDAEDPASGRSWAYGAYSDGSPIPRPHRRLYRARPDLQQAYADPFDASGERSLKRWMETQGPIEHPEYFEKKGGG
ncbi:MAG: hypothetical protein QM795_01430 [Pseudoxanthomonas sp.]